MCRLDDEDCLLRKHKTFALHRITDSYHTMCCIFGCRNGLILKGTQLLINYYILSHGVCLNILLFSVHMYLSGLLDVPFFSTYLILRYSSSGFERSGPASFHSILLFLWEIKASTPSYHHTCQLFSISRVWWQH